MTQQFPMRVLLGLSYLSCVLAGQTVLSHETIHDDRFELPHKIETVAVIGGGGTGLLHAATLIEHGFKVRIFERQTNPGGNWLYNDKVPIPAAFPYVHIYISFRFIQRHSSELLQLQFFSNRPLRTAAYIPDIPYKLPLTRTYSDGDEGLSNDWRLREHWIPSSTWFNMLTTVPPVCFQRCIVFTHCAESTLSSL